MNAPPNTRAILACVILPVIYGLERTAYYGMRSVLYVHAVQERGMEAERVRELMHTFAFSTYAFAVVGGLVAIGIGPRYTLAIGAAIACAGFSLLVADVDLLIALVPIAIGIGMLKPCLWAAAADALPDPQESARNALAVGLYFAINAASFLATLAAPQFGRQTGSYDGVFVACAAMMSFVFALALALAVAHTLSGRGQIRTETPFRWEPLLGVAALFAVSLPYFLSIDMGASLALTGSDRTAVGQLLALNPVFVSVTCAPLLLAMIALALTGTRAPTLVLVGGGMVVAALGVVPLILLPPEGAVLLAGVAVMAMGEAVVGPLMASRVVGGLHRRLVTLVYGVFLLGVAVGNSISGVLHEAPEKWLPAIAGAIVFVTIMCGVLVIALHLARSFLWPANETGSPEPEAEPAEPASATM